MDYYDCEEPYDGYEEGVEPLNLITEGYKDSDITEALLTAGLISEKMPKHICSMEKLVYVYGNPNEVYSQEEIQFAESIDKVYVYSDFSMKLKKGNMVCRVIAARICCGGYDAIKTCVFFEKIINKALDGFNIFFFMTEESVFFGCRVFNKDVKKNCALSKPIKTQEEFEQFQEELSFCSNSSEFMDFYNCYRLTIECEMPQEDYEMQIIKKRGMQLSYLEEIDNIQRDIGIDMLHEKERYHQLFKTNYEVPFVALLDEVEDGLSFIKSNRINTYELLFEANEIIRRGEETEKDIFTIQAKTENIISEEFKESEVEALLDDPEVAIKFFKNRRGI